MESAEGITISVSKSLGTRARLIAVKRLAYYRAHYPVELRDRDNMFQETPTHWVIHLVWRKK